MVLAGVWTIGIGSFTTRRLRSDLARWWLLRSLPLSPGDLLKDEILLSGGICTLVGLAAMAFSRLTVLNSLSAAVLLPILVANAALAAMQDILRQSKARTLMAPSLAEENVPRQNIWGVLQGLISVLIPYGILVWSFAGLRWPVLVAASFTLAAIFTWLNRKAVLSAYHWIE
jgi:hypothetical protein